MKDAMTQTQEILNMLPGSWEELKLRDFLKMIQVPITEQGEADNLFVGFDNTFKVIETLTGVTVEQLEDMPLMEAQKLAEKMAFINTLPVEKKKSGIKWKTVEETTYNDFILFNTYRDDLSPNLPAIIKSFSKNGYTEEEVLELSMAEVHTGFFTLRQTIKKWLKASMISTNNQLIDRMKTNRFKKSALRLLARTNPRLLQSAKSSDGTFS